MERERERAFLGNLNDDMQAAIFLNTLSNWFDKISPLEKIIHSHNWLKILTETLFYDMF